MAAAKSKKDRMRYVIAPIAVVMVFIIAAGVVLYQRRTAPGYNFADNMDATVISIDGESITWKDTAVYIYDIEARFDELAKSYNPNDPTEFWRVHFSAGENSTFTNDYAKSFVKELCVYDYVMEKEAAKADISLTDAEKKEAEAEARLWYQKLSEKALMNLAITQEAAIIMFTRRKLVKKYVAEASKSMTQSGYSQTDLVSQLSFDGEFYKGSIKSQYDISYDESQWEKMPIGTITIN